MSSEDPTLQNIIDQTELKWIFIGGKGGVGKTTCSCSLAIQLSKVRRNVLLISTDPAHNLSDAFRQKFSRKPTLVNGFTNLFAMEVDPTPEESELAMLTGAEGGDGFLTDLATSIPGIDEAMSFAEVMRQVQSMDYQTIVFDTAPTGHTLRLLQFPTTLQKGLEKIVALKGTIGGMLGPITRMMGMGGSGNPEDQLMGKLEELKNVVEKVNNQFQDPDLTTFVCVCIPEFLSLYETERLVQELVKFNIDCRNVIINQNVLPDPILIQVLFPESDHGSRLLAARVRMQQKYLEQFYDLYEDFHVVRLPLLEEEVRGADALKEFSVNLLTPYEPPTVKASAGNDALDKVLELEAENKALKQRIAELEKK